MGGTTPGTMLLRGLVFGAVIALLTACGPGCSERRESARAEPIRQRAESTSRGPADDYVSRVALDMAAEDQERSAESLDREPSVRHRDSPMRPPGR